MGKELAVDSKRIKAAALKCPQAASVLRELFPEAFMSPYDIDLSSVHISSDNTLNRILGDPIFKCFSIINTGKNAQSAFYLSSIDGPITWSVYKEGNYYALKPSRRIVSF